MNTDNITIQEDDLTLAQTLCSSISDTGIRNRAVANIIGAKIASRFFNEKYTVDTETGLHNIAHLLEQIDISDIYVNNSYIDVRVYFTEDELCVPKSHFDLDILPVAYMFIKINSNLSEGTVTGFIKPADVNRENLIQDYYYINESSLSYFYDFESHLTTTLDTFEIPNELIYKYTDGSLDQEAKNAVLKELVKSKSSRVKFAKIIKAQSVFDSVLITNEQEQISTESTVTTDDKNTLEELNDLYITSSDNEKSEDEELLEALDYTTEVTPSNSDLLAENNAEEQGFAQENNEYSEDEIGTLFTGEQEGVPVSKKKGSNGFVVVLLLILLGVSGYYAYTNYFKASGELAPNTLQEITDDNPLSVTEPAPATQQDAMPVETVEAVPNDKNKQEEAAPVAIPAIEKHLDASVLVSNLRVEWEIPVGYANNTAAKRYLFKLGKIIQLNLRSDLLLLSKPPLSNRITVELNFNPNSAKFELVGIKDSSGEKTVDNAITETIKNALSMHVSTNTETFGKLQGNPILIIRL